VISYLWPDPPRAGGLLDVAPGVIWLRMPLPFKLDHINLWLLEDGDGWTAVDTGVGLEETRALWDAALGGRLAGRPVTRIVVTHFHPDHMGNAQWLAARAGADVWCAQAEWLTAQLAARSAADVERRLAHFRRHGVGDEGLAALRGRANHYPRLVPSVPAHFRAVRDGDTLVIGGRRWEALTVLGHSPEQVVLHAPEAGVLIAGDQVLPRITTNVGVWPDQPLADPLRLYLDSLARFRTMAADTLVLPSHGLPFRGLPGRLDALARHHDDRLARTLAALDAPRTAAEVMTVLFQGDLDAHQLTFAVGETLAHLHRLEAQGRAVRRADADGHVRFARP
jgi:glyoxylase-like metal-dependent hydrolase (beta-lactamase superfamily II)